MEELFIGFTSLTWQVGVMYLVGLVLIWLAIKKEYEPMLLLPIGAGAILANLPLSPMIQDDGMLEVLKRGDRVVTVGGIHATIADIKDDVLSLYLAPNLRVKADRSAVSYVRSKGEE